MLIKKYQILKVLNTPVVNMLNIHNDTSANYSHSLSLNVKFDYKYDNASHIIQVDKNEFDFSKSGLAIYDLEKEAMYDLEKSYLITDHFSEYNPYNYLILPVYIIVNDPQEIRRLKIKSLML